MISLDDILKLHNASIQDYGGTPGIRDAGLLASALARPFQTFDRKELYPTPIEKAAAIGESLIVNHPFIDGNKRIGVLTLFALLQEYKILLTAPAHDLYDFVIDMSTGVIHFEEIVDWLRLHTVTP